MSTFITCPCCDNQEALSGTQCQVCEVWLPRDTECEWNRHRTDAAMKGRQQQEVNRRLGRSYSTRRFDSGEAAERLLNRREAQEWSRSNGYPDWVRLSHARIDAFYGKARPNRHILLNMTDTQKLILTAALKGWSRKELEQAMGVGQRGREIAIQRNLPTIRESVRRFIETCPTFVR